MGDDRRHEDLVFKYLLERWARTTPDRVFAWFHEEDSSWTWSEADRRANQAAHALAGAGASRGSHVAAMLPNGTRYLATIFGLGKLGAVHVGLNTAYRGAILEHALNLSESPLIVIDARFVDRLLGLDLRHLRSLVVFGQLDEPTRSAAAERFDLVDGTAFDHAPDHTPPVDQIHLWDPYAIIFTSGTTGPSKGVLSPYGQLAAQVGYYHVPSSTADDVYLVDLPMFHVGGQMALMGMLQVGGSIVMKEVFTATGYWELCIRYGITRATMLSTMANFLAAQPVSPLEKQHAVRSVLMAPVLDNVHAWQERFGIAEVGVMFNMTEVSSPLMRTGPVVEPATCGRPRPGAEVRVG
ncbi:MAG: AMP-binding protein, partial [Acidimicrobiia bacterium]